MGIHPHTSRKLENQELLDAEAMASLDEDIESKRTTKEMATSAAKARKESKRKDKKAFRVTMEEFERQRKAAANNDSKRRWHKLTRNDKEFLHHYIVEGKSAAEAQAIVSPGNSHSRQALQQAAARRMKKRSVQEFLRECLAEKGVTMEKISERIAAGLDAKKSMYDQKEGTWKESDLDDHGTQLKYIRTAAVMLGVNLTSKQEIEVNHNHNKKTGYDEEVEDALLEVLQRKHRRKSSIEGEEVSVKVKPNPTQDGSQSVPEKVQGDSGDDVGDDGTEE